MDIIRGIREDSRCLQGASTRSLVQAVPALQAHAFMQERMYVNAKDVQALAPALFPHRLQLAPGTRNALEVVEDGMKIPLEKLSRSLMR